MPKCYRVECPTCELDLALTIISYTPEEKPTWDYPGYPAEYEVGIVEEESDCECEYNQRDLDVYIDEVVEYWNDFY